MNGEWCVRGLLVAEAEVEPDALSCEVDGVCEVVERDESELLLLGDIAEDDAILVNAAEEVLVMDFSVNEDVVSLEVVAELEGRLVALWDKETLVSWNWLL
jgi:hypothetical protein